MDVRWRSHAGRSSSYGTCACASGSERSAATPLVVDMAFSPDGRTLASAGVDRTIRLWNLHTHKPLGVPLTGHTGAVFGVAFSRDGRTLASAGEDRTIRLWNVHTHSLLSARPTGDTDYAGSVAFSRDGRTLASAGEGRFECGRSCSGGTSPSCRAKCAASWARRLARPNGNSTPAASITGGVAREGGASACRVQTSPFNEILVAVGAERIVWHHGRAVARVPSNRSSRSSVL